MAHDENEWPVENHSYCPRMAWWNPTAGIMAGRYELVRCVQLWNLLAHDPRWPVTEENWAVYLASIREKAEMYAVMEPPEFDVYEIDESPEVIGRAIVALQAEHPDDEIDRIARIALAKLAFEKDDEPTDVAVVLSRHDAEAFDLIATRDGQGYSRRTGEAW